MLEPNQEQDFASKLMQKMMSGFEDFMKEEIERICKNAEKSIRDRAREYVTKYGISVAKFLNIDMAREGSDRIIITLKEEING